MRFVALADAPIDYSAAREAQLVRDGTPYLREVWHDAHWRVFEVAGARPLAGGAARVTAIEPERVRLTATGPGAVDLRVRFTPYWRIATGRGCVGAGARRLDAAARRAPRAGGRWRPRSPSDGCARPRRDARTEGGEPPPPANHKRIAGSC